MTAHSTPAVAAATAPADEFAPPMRTPRTVDIEITARCNLRCRYCYFFDNPAVPYADLPTADWLAFMDELGRNGVMRVTLQGGEPFLRPDLSEILRSAVANRMRFSILTNGTLIEPRMAAFIASTGRCDQVQVSLDGSCPAVHDAVRGIGSFELAVRGIRTLQRENVPTAVRVTLSRYNVADLENTVRFLLETLGVRLVGTNAAGLLGSCRLQSRDLLLDIEDRIRAMETLRRLSTRYPGRLVASAGPLAEDRLWRRMEAARANREAGFDDGGRLTGCGCPFSNMAVRADGAFIPCVLLAHLEMGRIRHDPLAEVWQRHPTLRELRNRRRIPLSQFEWCRGCPYLPYCTGHCPALALAHVGQLHHPAPDACLRWFLARGGRLEEAT